MAVLVLAEIQHDALAPATFSTLMAAQAFSLPIDVLVVGEDIKAYAKTVAQVEGVRQVLLADKPCFKQPLAEHLAPLLVEISKDYSHLLAPSTTYGKNIMPRVAALKDVMLISDCLKIIDEKTFVRPIYAGNACLTLESQDTLKLITIRATAFDPIEPSDNQASLVSLEQSFENADVSYVGAYKPESERPDLNAARIVISGGRGLGNKENFERLEKFAEKLGAAVGASRAAVDAGLVPNDYQVGQTGKIVAPELYMAFGISGAIQHLAGMKDSKIIVAINKDPEAPIFQVADYGLVGDLFQALTELEKALN